MAFFHVFTVVFAFVPAVCLDAEPNPADILERQLQQVKGKNTAGEIKLRMSLGSIQREQGQYTDAIENLQIARRLAARLGDTESIVDILQGLSAVKFRKGQLKDARSDLEMAKELLPTVDVKLSSVFQDLGNVRREMGHFDVALDLYQKAQEQNVADPDANVGVQLDVAETLANKGEFKKAQTIMQQTVRQLHRSGGQAARLAYAHSVLGAVHHAQGDVQQAGEMYNKSFKFQSSHLRATHPDLVMTQLRRSRLQRDSGDFTAAMRIVASLEDALWHEEASPDLTNALVVKADLLREERRYEEAAHAVETALEVHDQCCVGEENPDVAVAVHTHGSVLHDQGQFDLALEKYSKALEMNLRTVGSDHLETAATHNSLGTLYQDLDENAKAETHFAQCLEIQLRTVGTKSPEISNTYNNLATILFRKGSLEEAQTLLEKALQVLDDAHVPSSNPDRMVYEENLAQILKDLQESGVSVV